MTASIIEKKLLVFFNGRKDPERNQKDRKLVPRKKKRTKAQERCQRERVEDTGVQEAHLRAEGAFRAYLSGLEQGPKGAMDSKP